MTIDNSMGRQQGFTLLELMVVLVLLGIISGVAILGVSANDPARMVAYEANRLRQCLKLAGEEAAWKGRPLGLMVNPDGYGFMEFDKGWQVAVDPPCKARFWPKGVSTQLLVEGLPPPSLSKGAKSGQKTVDSKTSDEDEGGDKNNQLQPQIYLFASGEMTPFSLELIVAKSVYRLSGNMLGEFEIEQITL